MGYQLHRSGHHLLIHWSDTPSREMVDRLDRDIEAAFKATGTPLICFVVIATDAADPPGAEARRAFQAHMPKMLEQTASIDIVLMGDGVRASLTRTALRAMSMVMRTGDRIRIHDTPESAVQGRSIPATITAAMRSAPVT